MPVFLKAVDKMIVDKRMLLFFTLISLFIDNMLLKLTVFFYKTLHHYPIFYGMPFIAYKQPVPQAVWKAQEEMEYTFKPAIVLFKHLTLPVTIRLTGKAIVPFVFCYPNEYFG